MMYNNNMRNPKGAVISSHDLGGGVLIDEMYLFRLEQRIVEPGSKTKAIDE